MSRMLGAFTVAAFLVGCGAADEGFENDMTVETPQESLESILTEVEDLCQVSATDVNTILCSLSHDGQNVAELEYGCWANRGEYLINGEERETYDLFSAEVYCRAE